MRDKDLCLMTDTAVTASAATTDYLSGGSVQNAPGAGIYMMVTCTTTADSATDAATVVVSIQADDTTAFSSPTTLAQSASYAIASAGLTAGGRILVPMPFNAVKTEKYYRGYFTVGTENLSAGKFTVEFITNPQRNGI